MCKKSKIELLAPGGDKKSIKSAIAGGANAIYCGLDKFNARNRAENLNFDDLLGVINLAHANGVQVFLTLNIVILETEINSVVKLLNKLVNTQIDGVIVQDFGIFYLFKNFYPTLVVHASTQCTTHNVGQLDFLNALGAKRVNLCRELSLNEISYLTKNAHKKEMEVEVFVHGSNCVAFSGACYFSSVFGGNSGNRGRCSQPCRSEVVLDTNKKKYLFNLKDNCAIENLNELLEIGVDSLKIEGRIKSFDYVYSVVKEWKNQLENFTSSKEEFYKVFNRDYTNGYLTNNISKVMFIDNPRDNSLKYLADKNSEKSSEELEVLKGDFLDKKDELFKKIREEISSLETAKKDITIKLIGEENLPLKIEVCISEKSFFLSTKEVLKISSQGKGNLSQKAIFDRFKTVNEMGYNLKNIEISPSLEKMIIPFASLQKLKKEMLFVLNNNKDFVEEIELLRQEKKSFETPKLEILISNIKDLDKVKDIDSIFFEIPSSFNLQEFVEIFNNHKNIIPLFSSIIIGKDFENAVEFLRKINPKKIATSNTGIAFEANKLGIRWIATSQMNITNSFSQKCLKEMGCVGAFLSNELSKKQIRSVGAVEKFELHFSIFHPINLMTSRQCFFTQMGQCDKQNFDETCLKTCSKQEIIKNQNHQEILISKRAGFYTEVITNNRYYNLEVVEDFRNKFSHFCVDLREINQFSQIPKLQKLQEFIKGDFSLKEELSLEQTTNNQYLVGI